jgi:hypothetical protein
MDSEVIPWAENYAGKGEREMHREFCGDDY